jgi:phospholipid/cholesterol/gamma-HCH transport system substrate-binding protein
MSNRPKAPGPFTRTVRRSTQRLEGKELLLGFVVAAIGALLAWVAWASVNGVPLQNRYEVKVEVAADAPILKPGDTVRVAGRLAGLITDVEPDNGHVLVTAELRPDFAPIGTDARANVKVRSIVYLTYLELFPGSVDDPMPEGGTIPLARSSSGVDLLEVVQLFDRRARAALQDTVTSGGVGFAGRGEDVNAALQDLGASSADLTSQMQAATSQPGAIAGIVRGAAGTFAGLRSGDETNFGALIVESSSVAGAIAARNADLADSLDLLRPFEDEVLRAAPLADPLLDDAAVAARDLTPAARELAGALPAVNRVLGLGDRIRRETARLTAAINPVLVAAAPILHDLRPTVASIKPLLGPLRRLVDGVAPYERDIRLAGKGIIAATDNSIPVGQTAPDNPALRFAPIFTCHQARDPYPDPGEPLEHSQAC